MADSLHSEYMSRFLALALEYVKEAVANGVEHPKELVICLISPSAVACSSTWKDESKIDPFRG